MKKLFYLISLSLVISCHKEFTRPAPIRSDELSSVLAQLKDSLSPTDYQALDTGQVFLTPLEDGQTNLWRFAFRGKPIAGDFVLVQTDATGKIQRGTILHLENEDPGNPLSFNGNISIFSLSRQAILHSAITNGFIVSLHPWKEASVTTWGTKEKDVVPASAGGNVLPEVVIVGYVNSTGTPPNEQAFMNLLALMASSPNGDGAGASGSSATVGTGGSAPGTTTGTVGGMSMYTPLTPSGSGATTGGNLSTVVLTKPLQIEAEYTNSLTVIDIDKAFNCFNIVPSNGATYSIQICADVPINSSPMATVNLSSSGTSLGHTFLVATKTNGEVSVTQAFGFYPATTPSFLNPFDPVPSAIKDNGNQEINASLSMTVTGDQFGDFESMAYALSAHEYTLDSFNCSDFALQVFNSARSNAMKLKLDPYTVELPGPPGPDGISATSTPLTIPNSPQMLFERLQSMKTAGGPEAGNIQVDLTHNTKSPPSHGQCN